MRSREISLENTILFVFVLLQISCTKIVIPEIHQVLDSSGLIVMQYTYGNDERIKIDWDKSIEIANKKCESLGLLPVESNSERNQQCGSWDFMSKCIATTESVTYQCGLTEEIMARNAEIEKQEEMRLEKKRKDAEEKKYVEDVKKRIASEKEKIESDKKKKAEAEEFQRNLPKLKAECEKLYHQIKVAENECATAGDFQNCMRIKGPNRDMDFFCLPIMLIDLNNQLNSTK